MSWTKHHAKSEQYGRQALRAVRRQEFDRAWSLYEQAAQEEIFALRELKHGPPDKRGTTAVRAVHLLLNAGKTDQARALAAQVEQDDSLPTFAETQLHQLLKGQDVAGKRRFEQSPLLAASPAQLTPLTPNSNSSAVANGDPNNSVLVQFMSPPNGISWWTAMTSNALQPAVLNSNQGNNVITFKQGLTVSYHPSGGNAYMVLMSGMIVDSGTDYAFTSAILFTSTAT